MLNIFTTLAIDIHVSLRAEELFTLGPLTVTNSMLFGIITAVTMVVCVWLAARAIQVKVKKGPAQLLEYIMEFLLNLLEGPLGSRRMAAKYAPVFGVYFLFIMFSNVMALIPLVGPGLTMRVGGELTPLFRPFTADLNGTVAMAVIAIVMVQIMSIRAQGGKGHLRHYFSNQPWNPINFFIGILEVFGELTRILSLSLRLFLNTAVGEILISVFTSLILSGGRTPLAVLPIILFELLVAGIQAYVFTILAATYLGLAIAHAESADYHELDHDESSPKRSKDIHAYHG